MAFNVVSSLGNYLRRDHGDFQPMRDGAAEFRTENAAKDWIVENYGEHGLKVFHPVFAKRLDRSVDEDE